MQAWKQAFRSVMGEAQARFDHDATLADPDARGHRAPFGVYFFSETQLTIAGNSAHLEAPCLGLRFDGAWGVAAAGDARFFGSYGTAAAPTPVAATLAVDTVPGKGSALRVTLRQADGAVALGPLELSRVATPASEPAVCR